MCHLLILSKFLQIKTNFNFLWNKIVLFIVKSPYLFGKFFTFSEFSGNDFMKGSNVLRLVYLLGLFF